MCFFFHTNRKTVKLEIVTKRSQFFFFVIIVPTLMGIKYSVYNNFIVIIINAIRFWDIVLGEEEPETNSYRFIVGCFFFFFSRTKITINFSRSGTRPPTDDNRPLSWCFVDVKHDIIVRPFHRTITTTRSRFNRNIITFTETLNYVLPFWWLVCNGRSPCLRYPTALCPSCVRPTL